MAFLFSKMKISLRECRYLSTKFNNTLARKSTRTCVVSKYTKILSLPVWKLQTQIASLCGTAKRTEVYNSIDDLASAIAAGHEDPIHQNIERKKPITELLKTLVSLKPQGTEYSGSEENYKGSGELSLLEKTPLQNPPSGLLIHCAQELKKAVHDTNKPFQHCLDQAISSILKHSQLTDGSHNIENINSVITNILYGNIGFGVKTIVYFLDSFPEIFYCDPKELALRVENLRNIELKEGFLQRAISRTPQYLLEAPSKTSKAVHLLITKLDFKRSELPQLFLYSPRAILEPFEKTEETFQYIFFTMGYKKHNLIARHGILSYSLDHIRQRHLFLDRRGLYQQPDKNQNTAIENPKMKGMICYPKQRFCQEIALADPDEFELFKRVLTLEDAIRVKEECSEEVFDKEIEKQEQLADKFLKYL